MTNTKNTFITKTLYMFMTKASLIKKIKYYHKQKVVK